MRIAVAITTTLILQGGIAAAQSSVEKAPSTDAEHHDILPIPDYTYGNAGGCLMVLGDESDATALWLTPSEIGGTIFQCKIGKWSQATNGLIAANCGGRDFLMVVRPGKVPNVVLLDITGNQPFPAYILAPCDLSELIIG
jgi:hypothetical protein